MIHTKNKSYTQIQSTTNAVNGEDIVKSFENLSMKSHVAKDEKIFGQDMIIRFPRSDVKAKVNHATLLNSAKSEKQAYIYSKASEESSVAKGWKKKVSFMLAFHFQAPEPESWRLEKFPKNYVFIKRTRKEPASTGQLVTKHFLFYKPNNIAFQSASEFFIHALWLLSDANLEQKNCLCNRCSNSKIWRDLVEEPEKKFKKFILSQQVCIAQKECQTDEEQSIRTQRTSEPQCLPGVPLSTSTNLRDLDLAHFQDAVVGQNEGYRVGEFVFYSLRLPISWSDKGKQSKLTVWPASIVNSKVNPKNVKSNSSKQRVEKVGMYCVQLLGTKERYNVDASKLQPALQSISLLNFVQHRHLSAQDLKSVEKVELNLENGKERANILTIFNKLKIQFLRLQELRKLYTFTDPFENQQHRPSSLKRKSSSSDLNERNIKCQKTVAFSHASGQPNNYSALIEDEDSSNRRRSSLHSSSSESMSIKEGRKDFNQYFQGCILGLERVWVGDLVRLRLETSQVRQAIQTLLTHKSLNIPKDNKEPDLQSPLVLRIKAIYRASADESKEQTRFAGDLYRIVNKEDFERSEKEYIARAKESEDELTDERSSTESGNSWHPFASSISPTFPTTPTLAIPKSSSASRSLKKFLKSIQSKGHKLPQSPLLPDAFHYQLINSPGSEIVCCINHFAGRFYPSLVRENSNDNLVAEVRTQRTKQLNEQDDSEDKDRVKLSLAGLLPGFVKSMFVQGDTLHVDSRTELHKIAFKLADEAIRRADDCENGKEEDMVVQKENVQNLVNKGRISAQSSIVEFIDLGSESDEDQDIEFIKVEMNGQKEAGINQPTVSQDENMQQNEEVEPTNSKTTLQNGVHANGKSDQHTLQEDIPNEERKHPRDKKSSNIPNGWDARFSEKVGKWFYYDKETRECQWKLPVVSNAKD